MSEEKTPEKSKDSTEKNPSKRGKSAFVFGLIIVLLAVTGLGFLVNAGISAIKKNKDNSAEKQEYEQLLYPVIMLDPKPFDDVTGANMKELICSAVLSLITDSENNPYDYEFVEGEVSGLGIGCDKVNEAFEKLYGTEIKPVHQSVECSTCIFEYQDTAKRYVIPITGYDPAYTPKVYEINETKDGVIELLTGYIPCGDTGKYVNGEITEPKPAKYRKITLRKNDNGHYVSAIQNSDGSALKK